MSSSTEITTETITLSVSDGTTMPAYVARPTSGESKAGLLVYQEAFGVNEHIRDLTRRFAKLGYTSIAPALFHRTDASFEGSYTDFGPVMAHFGAITNEGLIADVTAAYDWLASPSGLGTTTIGAIGYCLGGRVAFLTDAILPIKAAASYYGGGIAPSPQRPGPGLLGYANDLHAPILLFWGGLDGHLGPDQRTAIDEALTAAGKNFAQIVFSRADHGFFCDARASYNPEASRQALALTLEFFDTYLV